MKVAVRGNASISDISKSIPKEGSYGCSLDFYKFSAAASETFFAAIDKIISSESRREWTEVAMQRLFRAGELVFEPLDVSGSKWVEIDNYADLAIADRLFSGFDDWKTRISAYYFDLDGTLYVGNTCVPGAADAIERLRRQGNRVFFISNNSSKIHADYAGKLAAMGIECSHDEILLSTDALINYLRNGEVRSVYVLGTSGLQDLLVSSGFAIDPVSPEYVIVGYDTELTYKKLVVACQLINAGVDYVVTHPDNFCPSEFGPIPDAGSIVKLLETTTGKAPKAVLGKPSPDMVAFHFHRTGLSPDRCAMVGDRLHTDMAMARSVGMKAIAVLSGEATRDAIEREPIFPDVVLNSVSDLSL
jgi:HAD superfamily hydrolase (TIGR01450 family)